MTCRDPVASRSFPPEVALYVTKMACELPANRSLALALWDCSELAERLVADGVVTSISADTVRRILAGSQLKPWRQHMWLSAKVPRDAAFAAAIKEICDLYTRLLGSNEVVLCVDEKTNIQPRKRATPTLPPRAVHARPFVSRTPTARRLWNASCSATFCNGPRRRIPSTGRPPQSPRSSPNARPPPPCPMPHDSATLLRGAVLSAGCLVLSAE